MENILPEGSTEVSEVPRALLHSLPRPRPNTTGHSQTASLSGRLASLIAGPWRRKKKATIPAHGPLKAQVSLTAPARTGKVEHFVPTQLPGAGHEKYVQ